MSKLLLPSQKTTDSIVGSSAAEYLTNVLKLGATVKQYLIIQTEGSR